MKGNNDMTDERLSLVFGEAMAPELSAEETFAAWDAFEKKHQLADDKDGKEDKDDKNGKDDKNYKGKKARVMAIGVAVASIAVAASLVLFVFRPFQQGTNAIGNPLELYAEVASPAQVEQTLEDDMCRVSTPASTTTLVTLEDGTKVTLNANSSIEYPRSFADAETREVKLKGEAHFEVTKNPHKPFVVMAGEMKTQVLGTVFDVKAYRMSSPKVTLLEGHVKVSNPETSVDMLPGQTAQLQSDKIIVSKASLNEGKDWLAGNFDMDQVSLAEAMGDIGAWYNKTVIFQSKANMDKLIHFRFSRKASLAEVITALNELGIAKIELKAGKVMVY